MGEWTLELADAFDFISTLEDGSVDALITDPPFGVTQLSWDKANDWDALWPLIYQKCKPSAVQVVFGVQPFVTDLICSNRKRFRYETVWCKSRGSGILNANRRPLAAHENILVFGAGGGTYNPQKTQGEPYRISRIGGKTGTQYGAHEHVDGAYDGLRFPLSWQAFPVEANNDKEHPSKKPLPLMTYLVKTYTNPGDTVLDLFSGSGTTGHACILTGRNFVGCEISEDYHRVATRRLESVSAQTQLFAPTT